MKKDLSDFCDLRNSLKWAIWATQSISIFLDRKMERFIWNNLIVVVCS